MDSFMDKLAQKLNAQEMIRANSQAETAEMKKLQMQLAAYDECLQEMRKLNLKNVELADKTERLVQEGIDKIAAIPEEDGNEQLLHDVKETLEQVSREFEDFVHKENVKVYRNVQAAVAEEAKAQTELLTQEQAEAKRKTSGMKPMMIMVLILTLTNAGMLIAQLLITFGIL